MEIRELLVKEKIDLAGVEAKVKALETYLQPRILPLIITGLRADEG